MRKTFAFALVGVSVLGFAVAAHAGRGHGDGNDQGEDQGNHRGRSHKVLVFGSMYGVDGPFLGAANAIRDVEGDEAPWVIDSARGTLDADGRLRLRVRGLVFADDPLVPPDLVGKNDETEFRALVSCLTELGDTVETANVVTRGFPASESGDSKIDARVDLPDPCVAPIVFVLAGSEDKWFAVTGIEKQDANSEDDNDDDDHQGNQND